MQPFEFITGRVFHVERIGHLGENRGTPEPLALTFTLHVAARTA